MIAVGGWTERAAALRDELVAAGKLTSPHWQAALLGVPRHEFVPEFYERGSDPPRWRGHRTVTAPASSSPSLMTRMLGALDIRDGHRVLEMGTGTGYNAALMSHRLGAEKVFSVDVDERLVDSARDRLAALGYHPTPAAVDGVTGLPEHAPYDRIVATCAVSRMPWSWAGQVNEGGRIPVDLKVHTSVGNLVLLRREGDRKAVSTPTMPRSCICAPQPFTSNPRPDQRATAPTRSGEQPR